MFEQEITEGRWKRLQAKMWGFYYSKFGSFSKIGLGLTVAGLVFIALAPRLGMSLDNANVVQAIASVILNFFLNWKTTWADRRKSGVFWQFMRFWPAKVITILINKELFKAVMLSFALAHGHDLSVTLPIIGTVAIMTDFTWAYLISTGIIMYANFFLMEDYTFGERGLLKDIFAMFYNMATWPFFYVYFMVKKVRE